MKSLLLFLIFFVISYPLFKKLFSYKLTMLVDLDTIIDSREIIDRAKIYKENVPNGDFDKYFEAHVLEQKPIPYAVKTCISLQQLGHKLIFFTTRPEKLRIKTCCFLNEWGLDGRLYMNEMTNSIENSIDYKKDYKKYYYKHIIEEHPKIGVVIDSEKGIIELKTYFKLL